MQSLEKIGVLEQDEDKGGRRITQSGRRDLDREWRAFLSTFPSLSDAFYQECDELGWDVHLGNDAENPLGNVCSDLGDYRNLLTWFFPGIAQTTVEADDEEEEEE